MPHPNTGLPLEERFWSKVDKSGDCWIWRGAKGGYGYGRILREYGGKVAPAHLIAMELTTGQTVPVGMRVLHRCDTPGCVRPDHLFIGTQRDNVIDMYRKGRGGKKGQKGEANHSAKISAEQAVEIRKRYAAGESQSSIARDFGIGRANVGCITRGQTWR